LPRSRPGYGRYRTTGLAVTERGFVLGVTVFAHLESSIENKANTANGLSQETLLTGVRVATEG
jgi:hypothetical protein